MDEQLFWQSLVALGGLQHMWWYSAVVMPALGMALLAVLLMTFALRRVERRISMFILLLVAWLPLVLIGPSFFIALRPQSALSYAGLAWPTAANELPRQALQTFSLYLASLAQLGVMGLMLATLLSVGSMAVVAAGSNVPIVSERARQMTNLVRTSWDKTKYFVTGKASPNQAQITLADSPYGRLQVLNGAHVGDHFRIRPMNIIGRRECDIVISDEGVSRKHAQFNVDSYDQTTIMDLDSANGLFVYRTDEVAERHKHHITSSGQPFLLRSGDEIALGDPDDATHGHDAVKLRFEHEHF